MSSPRVLVLGAGVIGLTTALSLLRRGACVTVLADRFAPDVTSVVAGALWEWPPAVCGHHQDQVSISRSQKWCMRSYREFTELALDSATGVSLRPVIFYFRHPVHSNARDVRKMEELRHQTAEFRHDARLIHEHGVNPDFGVVDAYTHLAPMIDTDVYMNWLEREVSRCGGAFVKERVSASEDWKNLAARFRSELIVNCTGLGARDLGDDSVYPVRGALVRVLSRSISPVLNVAHCVSHDETLDAEHFVFIVPRGENLIVLGGLAEPEEWGMNIDLNNYEPIRAMYRRCQDFFPALKSAVLDESEPVRVGLRPFRRQNVRLESETGQPVIHCYGHGGSGVTLSWGCAEEVSSMIFSSSISSDGAAISQP